MNSAGIKESSYRSESEDDRTHSHRETGAGAHSPVSLPGHASLRLPNSEQATSHPGWVPGLQTNLEELCCCPSWWNTEYISALCFCFYTQCVFVGTLCMTRVCVTFVICRFKLPSVFVCVYEYRLCEWWRDVYSFVPAGSLFRGGSADLYWGDNSCSGAPAQGESFSSATLKPAFCRQVFNSYRWNIFNPNTRSFSILSTFFYHANFVQQWSFH